MEASKIQEIMKRLKGLPYQKVLFNGPWGIGKTKHISDSIEGDENIIYISLFGKNNINVFYEELYYQLLSSNKVKMQKVLTHMEKIDFSKFGFSISVPLITDILKNIQKELSEKEDITIIIDDLERKIDSLGIKEIFGFIDSITKDERIKIVLVTSTENLPDKEKEEFDNYAEKSIDRIYEITKYADDAPEKIMGENIWPSLKELYINHQIKNLRTLKKTKYFIEEVTDQIPEGIFNKKINKEDIYKICAAIIIFVVDHNKRRELLPGTKENNPNYIWHHILERNLKNSMMYTLIPLILNWYETGDFSKEQLRSLFKQIDTYKETKIPLFMSDSQLEKEIADFSTFISDFDKNMSISAFMQRLDEIASITEQTNLELTYSIDEVVEWILRNSDFENSFSNTYFDFLSRRESRFINEVIEVLKVKSVEYYSNQLLSKIISNIKKRRFSDRDVNLVKDFRLLLGRVNIHHKNEKEEIINKMKDNQWLIPLPTGEITHNHWSYCHDIFACIKFLGEKEEVIKENACKYFNREIDKSLDEMFKYRIKSLTEQYLK